MEIQPHELVSFGDRYEFPEREVRPGQTATLTALPGPPLRLAFGMLALADPWWPEGAPTHPLIGLGKSEHPTGLSTIGILRAGRADPATVPCAASIGQVDRVATWRPLVQDEAHFHLQVDSGLGAFYDITDAAALLPSFQDDHHMKQIFDRTLAEQAITMEAGNRVAAVVFECPDGPGLYPVYAGYDKDGQAVAVLVDLLILNGAEQRVD